MFLDAWPDEWVAPLPFPVGFGVHRVVIDPGHGAPGNSGNRDAFCVTEEDATLALATEVAARLRATGHFEVRLARSAAERPEYTTRIAEAAAWGAEALVSLHSDVRGAEAWRAADGCMHSNGAPGFALLWSDEGALAQARSALADAVAGRMADAGFLPYDGSDYVGLYEATGTGVFVDRHSPEQRIRMLRRPAMPSVIVETHHAWNVAEATAWTSPALREDFAEALALGLADVLHAPAVAGE